MYPILKTCETVLYGKPLGEKNLINSLLPKGLDIYLQVTIQVTEHTKTFFFYIRQSFHNL